MATKTYILYGEDNKSHACYARAAVLAENTIEEICTVSNGFEILQHLQEVKTGEAYPSLIILNINMPKLKGKDTLELLKTDDFYRLIPVVMLSETDDVTDALFFEGLNTQVYKKPENALAWKDMLQEVCNNHL